MKTPPKIRIEVALPPANVLEQLANWGKDGRESKLPPEIRGAAVWLKVQGSTFDLQLARDTYIVWRGSVVDAEHGGGSAITASAQPVRMSVLGWLLIIALLAGLLIFRGLSAASALVLSLAVIALVLALEPLSRARYAKREAPLCRAILLRAMQVTSASSTD